MSRTVAISEAIAHRLLEILDARGVSVNHLAAWTGIPRPTLDRHLKVTPWMLRLGEIEVITTALDISFDELLLDATQVAA